MSRSLNRFGDEIFFHEILIQSDAEAWAIRHVDEAVLFGLDTFQSQFMAHGGIIDAIFEDESVATGGQPMEACRNGDWAGVTMIAKAGVNFLDARADES